MCGSTPQSIEQLDYYLDEFTFRSNRRTSRSRGLLFYRVLQQALDTDPHPYNELTTTSSLDPLHMGLGALNDIPHTYVAQLAQSTTWQDEPLGPTAEATVGRTMLSMLGAALDIFRIRQYFNVMTQIREVADGVRDDAQFHRTVRRALLPLPLDRVRSPSTPFHLARSSMSVA